MTDLRLWDWIPSMKTVMEHGEIGDVFEVEHIVFMPNGTPVSVGGSTYMKTSYGYTHAALKNRDLIIGTDPYSITGRKQEVR